MQRTPTSVWVIAAGVAALLVAPASAQSTIYVDDDAAPGGNGLTWPTAYRFVQDGLTHALDSMGAVEEIRVAQGTYVPDRDALTPLGTGDRDATFQLLDGVALLGGYRGGLVDADDRDVALYETILSGDLLGDDAADFVNYGENSHHVVTGSGTTGTAIIDGATVSGGRADGAPWPAFGTLGAGMLNESGSPTVRFCTFSANWANHYGGAMENLFGASPMISDCQFNGNQVSPGDGSFATGGAIDNIGGTEPVITDCDFVGNVIRAVGGNARGGAIYLEGEWADPPFESGTLTLSGCTFANNTIEGESGATAAGGGVLVAEGSARVESCTFSGNRVGPSGFGGAFIVRDASDAVFIDCTFSGNQAHGSASLGGGVLVAPASDAVLVDCTLEQNSAGQAGGGMRVGAAATVDLVNCRFVENVALFGGGLHSQSANLAAINCNFSGNSVPTYGGGMYNYETDARVYDCTFAANSAGDEGGAMWNTHGSYPTVVNSICWGNVGGEIDNHVDSDCTVRYSDVQGGYVGEGNIDDDPIFVDPVASDFRLQAGSPCIDAGHNWLVPPDAEDLDGDGDRTECAPHDLDGAPRFRDDETKDDTGCGSPAVVDMGAHEADGTAAHPVIVGDLTGDGSIGFADLTALLAVWGPCPAGCCAADLNVDGNVGFADLTTLLASWG